MREEMPVRLRADPERVRVSVRRDGSAWNVRIESRSDPNMNNIHTTTNHPPFGLEDILREAAEFIDGIELEPLQSDRGFAHPFGRTCLREEYDIAEDEGEGDDS